MECCPWIYLNIINFVISLLILPANFIVLVYLFLVKPSDLRRQTIKMFFLVAAISTINAAYYIVRFFDIVSSNPLASYRSIATNILLLIASWSFVYYIKDLRKEK